jgi:hypothetical protein
VNGTEAYGSAIVLQVQQPGEGIEGMSIAAAAADPTSGEGGPAHWRRNLLVCFFGSFTTIVAMTLLLPFLPLFIEQLGMRDQATIMQWSGIAYGATFLSAAFVAPLWGRLAGRYGRKMMLIRASLGMAIAISLTGMAQDVYQLVGLRLRIRLLRAGGDADAKGPLRLGAAGHAQFRNHGRQLGRSPARGRAAADGRPACHLPHCWSRDLRRLPRHHRLHP